jgi:hypothetical protein
MRRAFLFAALALTGWSASASADVGAADEWHRLSSKSGSFSVELPCVPEEAASLVASAQKFVPAETRLVIDAVCYSDRALFTAQTVPIANPKSRFSVMWANSLNGRFGKHATLANGRRAIDVKAVVEGGEATTRYLEATDGGYIALTVQRLAIDDVTADTTRYFASFKIEARS